MSSRPPQYTTTPNKYKAPIWAGPNLWWNPDYLAWREDMDAKNPVPYAERHFDADEALQPADDDDQEPRETYFKPAFNLWVGDPSHKKRGVA